MEYKTTGTVISAAKQWWLKINTKPVRTHSLDSAIFPYIIKVSYTVEGTEYTRRKWIGAGKPVPAPGSSVTVIYPNDKPGKGKIICSE
ncbi:MAG: sugar ABC transporter permease [Oscillospiraceae bacterium]|nr:sugar ABC transporter permease [Oscillospiraceae bacterium]